MVEIYRYDGWNKTKAYRTYQKLMNEYENVFAVVKTAHKSKWDNLQLSTYQMNNSLPCTDKRYWEKLSDKQ